MRNDSIVRGGQRCLCGALTEDGLSRCRKCFSRSRWYRRKSWKCTAHPIRHSTCRTQTNGGR